MRPGFASLLPPSCLSYALCDLCTKAWIFIKSNQPGSQEIGYEEQVDLLFARICIALFFICRNNLTDASCIPKRYRHSVFAKITGIYITKVEVDLNSSR